MKSKNNKRITLIVFFIILLIIVILVTLCLAKRNRKTGDKELTADKSVFINDEIEESSNYKYSVSKGTGKNLVGKYVKYNDDMYIILYDDETNGLQMISQKTLKNDFYLGWSDTTIDWTSSTVKNETDLNEDGILNNFEKSIYSYNHAINTLNTECSNLVATNSNIIGVRCVGSDPIRPNSENRKMYSSTFLENNPNSEDMGIGNNIGYDTDTNYVSDFDKMVTLGINKTENLCWLASRIIYIKQKETSFNIRRVHYDGRNS